MVRKTVKTKKGVKVLYEYFDNPVELLEVVSTRDMNDEYKGHPPTIKSLDKHWHGVSNFEEAKQLLNYGWTEKIEYFKKRLSVHQSHLNTTYKPRIKADYVGSAPIVANAIMGLPNSMIGTNYVPKKHKVLNFLIDAGCSSFYEPEQMLDWGAKVVATINKLERSGYRCKVEVMYNFSRENENSQQQIIRFKVKNANQPIDLQRFTYPIAHPSMFRVIGFTWEETLPGGKKYSGKGSPLHTYSVEFREDLVQSICEKGETTIYTNIREDLESSLKNIGWNEKGGE